MDTYIIYGPIPNPFSHSGKELTEKEVEFFLSVTDEEKKELLSRYFSRLCSSWIILSPNGENPGKYHNERGSIIH